MRRVATQYLFAVGAILVLMVIAVRAARVLSRPGVARPTVATTTAAVPAATSAPRGPGRPVVLFFADPEGKGLVARRGEVFAGADASSQATGTLLALLKGPAPDATDVLRAVPEGVELRALFLDGHGTATVDLGKLAAALAGSGSETEVLALWAVVDTLAFNFPADARRVRVLLDGREVEAAGHVALGAPLTPRRDLVVGEIPSLAAAAPAPAQTTDPDPIPPDEE